MKYQNLHCHTTFSDGLHSLEENVLAAIEAGMPALGISDHSFTACDLSYCMGAENYPRYLAELERVKKAYADRIMVYAGLELDSMSRMDTKDLDYVIASVHYLAVNGVCYPVDESLEEQQRCVREAFGGNWLAMAGWYYQTLVHHVQRVKPTFVGHVDIINKYSQMPLEDPAYQKIATDALAQILESCPYIEVNTGIIARGLQKHPYPATFLLKAAQKLGAELVLTSDSHHKEKLTFWFDEAVALLKEVGFDHINIFDGKAFQKQSI